LVSNSESFFQRTLEQKTKEAREAVQTCVVSFLTHSPNERQSAAKTAFDAVGRIVDMLHPRDRPPWLDPLHAALKVAHSNHHDQHGVQNIQRVANEYQVALNRHKWRLADVDAATGFDFDAVYDKYKAENRIPQLFDEIISALCDIIATGKIDSVRALDELRRILATIQNAKNGSYFATRSAWFFVATWFKNTGWEMLGDIPILGAAVRGLRKSLQDMNDGMQNLHEQMQADLQSQLSKDFPGIEYRAPEIPRLEHEPATQQGEPT
jgi:hypothetical protein